MFCCIITLWKFEANMTIKEDFGLCAPLVWGRVNYLKGIKSFYRTRSTWQEYLYSNVPRGIKTSFKPNTNTNTPSYRYEHCSRACSHGLLQERTCTSMLSPKRKKMIKGKYLGQKRLHKGGYKFNLEKQVRNSVREKQWNYQYSCDSLIFSLCLMNFFLLFTHCQCKILKKFRAICKMS